MIWVPLKHRMQSELLKRGHCVACTRSLSEADRTNTSHDELSIVTCECKRIYIYDKNLNAYRRATNSELAKYA